MALSVGQAQIDPTGGLAGAIWEDVKTRLVLGAYTPTQTLALRKLCESIATGVVNYIHTNAVVSGSSVT